MCESVVSPQPCQQSVLSPSGFSPVWSEKCGWQFSVHVFCWLFFSIFLTFKNYLYCVFAHCLNNLQVCFLWKAVFFYSANGIFCYSEDFVFMKWLGFEITSNFLQERSAIFSFPAPVCQKRGRVDVGDSLWCLPRGIFQEDSSVASAVGRNRKGQWFSTLLIGACKLESPWRHYSSSQLVVLLIKTSRPWLCGPVVPQWLVTVQLNCEGPRADNWGPSGFDRNFFCVHMIDKWL